jgi:hypothetical protein
MQSSNPSAGFYPSEMKAYIHPKTSTQTFLAALFMITNMAFCG